MSNWQPVWGKNRPKIGFIGLGIMGKPMARNLMNAGYELTVYNRSKASVEELTGEGAIAASSPQEVAAKSDLTITIVTDSPDVVDVVLGQNGLVEGVREGAVHIDMTTMSPEVTRQVAAELRAKGVRMLDAPVSGGDTGARAGTLSIMVGGEAEVFAACKAVLDCMGRNVVHVGETGMGQTVKLCNQVICGLNILAVAEGIAFATKAGADLDKVLEVVTKGAAGSWMLENLGPKMVAGDYAPGFMVKLQQKDLRLALEAGDQLQMPLPGTGLVQQLFRYVQATGGGDEGTQALVKTLKVLGQSQDVGGGQDLGGTSHA